MLVRSPTEDDLLLLADAQTSAGLLVVVGELPGYPVVGHTVIGRGIEVRRRDSQAET
jgi:selenide, water dikinase